MEEKGALFPLTLRSEEGRCTFLTILPLTLERGEGRYTLLAILTLTPRGDKGALLLLTGRRREMQQLCFTPLSTLILSPKGRGNLHERSGKLGISIRNEET
jgi:hypothetical protein